MNPLLTIDPGASGGYAWRDAEGIVHAAASSTATRKSPCSSIRRPIGDAA